MYASIGQIYRDAAAMVQFPSNGQHESSSSSYILTLSSALNHDKEEVYRLLEEWNVQQEECNKSPDELVMQLIFGLPMLPQIRYSNCVEGSIYGLVIRKFFSFC
jgi:hypothetical protein